MSNAINCKKLVAFALSSYSRLDPIFHKKAGRSLINCELTFLSNCNTRNQTKTNSCFFQQYNKNTLPLTETRKKKGVELIILLSYQQRRYQLTFSTAPQALLSVEL